MKIAFIGLRGVPASYSGVEKSVEEIGKRLVSKGHEITVYCMKNKSNTCLNTYCGMRLVYIPCIAGKNVEMLLYSFISVLTACLSKVDIIHLQAIGPSSMAIIARLFFKKVVVTNHGLDWKRSKWGFIAKKYLKFGEWVSVKFSHATIAVSDYIKEYYKEKYNKEVIYIPNGKETTDQLSLDILQKNSLKSFQYILYIGRITPEKNVDFLCSAFKNISINMKLVIVGTSQDDYLEKLEKKYRNEERIIFTGPVYERKSVAALYSNSYLFVLPSDIEGQSVVILEALSYKCDVLVSDIPENLDLVKSYGHYFKAGDKFDLQCNLFNLMTSPEKLNKEDCTEYLKQFDWNKIALQTLEVYEKILCD